MKIATTLILMAPLWAQIPVRSANVVTTGDRQSSAQSPLHEVEKRLDAKLSIIGGADPVDVVGYTRALYLEGYGTVLTAEMDLVRTPVPTPFHQTISPAEKTTVHQHKVTNLAQLKKTMQEMWQDAAANLTSQPDNEQVVLAVRLFYRSWEDMTGLPEQIVMKGTRKGGLAGVQTEEK